jgi:hypothetical protein
MLPGAALAAARGVRTTSAMLMIGRAMSGFR